MLSWYWLSELFVKCVYYRRRWKKGSQTQVVLISKNTTEWGERLKNDQKTGCLAAGGRRFEFSSNPTNLPLLQSVLSPLVCHLTLIIRQQTLTIYTGIYLDVISIPEWQTQTHSEKSTRCRFVPMVTRTNKSQLLTEY